MSAQAPAAIAAVPSVPLAPPHGAHPLVHVSAATRGWRGGSITRTYRRSQRAALKANALAPVAEHRASELAEWLAVYDSAERMPSIGPLLSHVASWLAVAVEVPLGAALGWEVASGSNPLASGWSLVVAGASCIGFGGVFGVAGLLLGESLGRTGARLLARADGRSLRPTAAGRDPMAMHRGSVARHPVAALATALALGALAFVAYFAANTIRAVVIETASMPVSTTAVATIGTIVPLSLALLKAQWYSHEAAVEHHRLAVAWRRAMRRWRRRAGRAAALDALHRGVRLRVVAEECPFDANGATPASIVTAVLDRQLPMMPLREPSIPDAFQADGIIARAERAMRELP